MNAPNSEKNNLENEKLRLEIAQLRKQMEKSIYYEILIDKWGPALIAGIVLFTLVPLANYILWKNQKSIDINNIYLTRKMELYAESASNVTRFSQLINLIHKCIEYKTNPQNVPIEAIGFKDIKISDLEKERLDIEARLVKTFREIKLYFGQNPSKKVDVIRNLYNKYKGCCLDDKFVDEFRENCYELFVLLENEIREDLKISVRQ